MRTSAILSNITLGSLLLAAVAGCGSGSADSPVATSSGVKPATYKPTVLHLAFVPSDDIEQMRAGFKKLADYLEKDLNIKVEVKDVTSYGAVIEAMKKKRVDLAWFSPMSYVLAEKEADASAVLESVDTKGVTTYTGYILVPGNSTAKTIQDLKGKNVGFVEAASTSGGLVPSFLILKAVGQPASQFCNISYLGSHDSVVNAVKNGSVDAGATNNLTLDRMIAQGKLKPTDVRILVKSDPIPGSPMAVRKDLDPEFRKKLLDAISASPKALGVYNIAGFGEIASFKAIGPADYQVVRDMVTKLDLKREEMLK